jgi:hypothetical protein
VTEYTASSVTPQVGVLSHQYQFLGILSLQLAVRQTARKKIASAEAPRKKIRERRMHRGKGEKVDTSELFENLKI